MKWLTDLARWARTIFTTNKPSQTAFLLVLLALVAFASTTPIKAAPWAKIQQDVAHKLITLSDAQGHLSLRLNYDGKCVLDQVNVRGRQVAAPDGVGSGILIGGHWYTTKSGISEPKVVVRKNTLTVSGITFGEPGSEISETWLFTLKYEGINWKITRTYPKELALEDAAFPAWNFASMATWTGGILDTGGVVLSKYLDQPNGTYGAHAGTVTLWNRQKNDCLRIAPTLGDNLHGTVRFSHQPAPDGDEFTFNYAISRQERTPKHGLSRYLGNRQDLWAPFKAQAAQQSVEFSLQALDYAKTYDRGTFKGIDGGSIREIMNTVGRYGVIDDHLVGGNGWRSGYICLHEQWFPQIGMVLDDPNYNANYAAALDYYRDNAVQPDGRVLSRWCYGSFDAMPGTYTDKGFYEAQWGYLLDSQTDYVIDVAEQFNLSGDKQWLAGQKQTCERVLDYMLRREVANTGIVAMMTDSHLQNRGSDWFDIVWAAHQNALVNAELYYALILWADNEETLGSPEKATSYRAFAARLKSTFNKPLAEGGFWDPANKWYVYWRDKDGSVHGSNLFTAVNFAAISYGLCDDKERQKAILDGIEAFMQKEGLFHWPTNFLPFVPDEVGGGNLPFPRYENGDIFLSWGEVAVRAYAPHNPALALKYIKKVLVRYEEDGLSFQRYLRADQKGAGDDILAGNCMAIVGLYRDIYGLQPQYNRLYLEPHMIPELNGTELRYQLRGKQYQIDLDTSGSSITTSGCTLRSTFPFAVNATDTGLEYFSGHNKQWSLAVATPTTQPVTIQIENWPATSDTSRQWTEMAPTKGKTRYTVAGLRPDATYYLTINGKRKATLGSDNAGSVNFASNHSAASRQQLELRLSS